jgi:predicted nuclease of restriction endonuclease-like (RecB) superfamily
VLLGVATGHGGLGTDAAPAITLAVAISMLLTPFLLALHDHLAPRFFAAPGEERAPDVPQASRVIVAGLGRVGQVVARMLHASGHQPTVLDDDPDHVEQSRKFGFRVFYGDATRLDLLHAAGADSADFLIITLDDPLKREFYAAMCRAEQWSTRTLAHKIQSMLYERTALSAKPEELVREELSRLRERGTLTPDLVLQDPYILDFLGLADSYSERDLESALLRDIERFLLELGTGFAFVERQKRITVDGDDYYLDLLFFHRRLRRLIAIDLKLGRFHAGDKGQMELYLRWLDKYDRRAGEESPLGLILCAGKSEEHVELLQLDKSSIRIAEYVTELPPREVLGQKLHAAITAARRRMETIPQDLALEGEPE